MLMGSWVRSPAFLSVFLTQDTRQIAGAIEYAHERRVIHRDLKPVNIKITPEGRVKVLDFGLAKAMYGEAKVGRPNQFPYYHDARRPQK
jgi:serine/threonine protein kinase